MDGRKIIYDSQGTEFICNKEFDILENPCAYCDYEECSERDVEEN